MGPKQKQRYAEMINTYRNKSNFKKKAFPVGFNGYKVIHHPRGAARKVILAVFPKGNIAL